MAYFLALETSSTLCSVALADNHGILSLHTLYTPHSHDKMLAVLVERMYTDAGIAMADISAVCVSAGPGSFSGLRIGGALAKGLCYANQPQLVAVPTLTALASHVVESAHLCSADTIIATQASHKDILYWQEFSWGINTEGQKTVQPLSSVKQSTTDECVSALRTLSRQSILITGTASRWLLPSSFVGDTEFRVSSLHIVPTAEMIAHYGFTMIQREQFVQAEDFVPQYGQDFLPKPA